MKKKKSYKRSFFAMNIKPTYVRKIIAAHFIELHALCINQAANFPYIINLDLPTWFERRLILCTYIFFSTDVNGNNFNNQTINNQQSGSSFNYGDYCKYEWRDQKRVPKVPTQKKFIPSVLYFRCQILNSRNFCMG